MHTHSPKCILRRGDTKDDLGHFDGPAKLVGRPRNDLHIVVAVGIVCSRFVVCCEFSLKGKYIYSASFLPPLLKTGNFATATEEEIMRHLDMGRDLLARGQLADALTHYHAAVGEFLLPPIIK